MAMHRNPPGPCTWGILVRKVFHSQLPLVQLQMLLSQAWLQGQAPWQPHPTTVPAVPLALLLLPLPMEGNEPAQGLAGHSE